MAIGDAVATYVGSGGQTRQPSSGVEERISAIVKSRTTDSLRKTEGSNTFLAPVCAVNAGGRYPAATIDTSRQVQDIAIVITNTLYIQSSGTTDFIRIDGVQFNV